MDTAARRVGLIVLFMAVAAEAGAQCGPWMTVPGPPAQGSRAAVWTGSRFVAVGDGFFTSPDGRSWRNVPQAGFPPLGDAGLSWSAVAFDGTLLVAVADRGGLDPRGDTGAIAVSDAGEHWKVVVPRTGRGLHTVAWGGGRWVAAGGGTVLWSDDGRTWHEATVAEDGWTMDVLSVAFTGARWVAVGQDVSSGGGLMATSEDGTSWTVATTDALLFGVAGLKISDDGVSWTRIPAGLPSSPTFAGLAAGEPGFVVSVQSTEGGLYFSANGTSWQRAASPDGSTLPQGPVSWAEDRFLAASRDRVATSTDGVQWTVKKGDWGVNGFSAFAGNGDRFVGIAGAASWPGRTMASTGPRKATFPRAISSASRGTAKSSSWPAPGFSCAARMGSSGVRSP